MAPGYSGTNEEPMQLAACRSLVLTSSVGQMSWFLQGALLERVVPSGWQTVPTPSCRPTHLVGILNRPHIKACNAVVSPF